MNKSNSKQNPRSKSGKQTYSDKDKRKSKEGNEYKSKDNTPFFPEARADYSRSNNINWWNKTTAVYDNAVKIPFNRIMGDPVEVAHTYNTPGAQELIAYSGNLNVPGVLAVKYAPAIGTCSTHSDAVNIAFDALWARIYREYTGAEKFTKAELAFHVLHAMNIAVGVGEIKRILRSINSYAQQNHNFPRVIYAACADDPDCTYFDSIAQNMPYWEARLNKIIYNFNSLYIPNFTDAFDRWYSLSSNVWMDEDIISASAYVFRSAGYYTLEYDTTAEDHFYYLEWHTSNRPSGTSWIDTLCTRCEELLGALRNSTNFSIVNAAIAKVYFGSNLRQIELFSHGEVLNPTFDRNMMYQLNNLELFGHDLQHASNTSLNVYEDVLDNVVVYKPEAYQPTYFIANREGYLLNSYDSNTDAEFIMESTRLKPHYINGNPNIGDQSHKYLDVGTEIPWSMTMYYYTNESQNHNTMKIARSIELGGNSITFMIGEGASADTLYTRLTLQQGNIMNADQFSTFASNTNDLSSAILNFIALLSKFRNHPYLYINRFGYSPQSKTATGSNSRQFYLATVGDVTTYTMITDEGLRGLNEAALLSVYNVV